MFHFLPFASGQNTGASFTENFQMAASKHFAPQVHILKTSKNDPEEIPV